MKTSSRRRKKISRDVLLAFILLVVPFAFIFWVKPVQIIDVINLSFNEVKLRLGGLIKNYVGFGNYLKIPTDELAIKSLSITAFFTVMSVSLSTLIAFGLALLMNEEFKGRGFLRVIFLIPWAVPGVVNGQIWKWIFSGAYGALNGLLFQFGIITDYVNWLGDVNIAPYAVVFADVWVAVPLFSLIFLASLQTIPTSLYDSAHIDGANRFQRLIRITLPSIKNQIFVVLIWNSIRALKVFDLVYVLTAGGPLNATTVFSLYIYNNSFMFSKYGYASALATILTIIIITLTAIYLLGFRLELEEIR